MSERPAVIIACVLAAAGVAARLSNGWHFPVLGSYDAFSHFSYIWHLAETGRVPVASQGWSYFHPPLYYALMTAVWKLFAGSDALVRLHIGTALVALAGCLHPLAAWWVVRRSFPSDPRFAWMSAALLSCTPVMIYSAGFLGNEGLHAVLGTLGLLLLLAVLKRPRAGRSLALGIALGLAMLAKFSAITIVLAAVLAIALKSATSREFRGGWKALAVAAAACLAVCGPYYARNVLLFGTPFQMARNITFMTAYVEENQPQAARGWADYLTFDPLIFRRPQWPRGSTPGEDTAPYGLERAMRETVWTGLYANTWFDGFGGWVLPPVTESEAARRAGQLLLVLGLVPSAVMLLGLWTALGKLRRRWDDETVSFGLATAMMLLLFVYGTRQAPIAAAVKATYFTPVCLAFAFWFASGLASLREQRPRWFNGASALCGVLAALSVLVFWQGIVFDPSTWRSSLPHYEEGRDNQYGVIYYAGGQTADARRMFEKTAAAGCRLAFENLGFLAIDEGKAREGLRLLRRAASLPLEQDGGPQGRERFVRLTEAEQQHSIAVALHGLGRRDKAVQAWHRALQRDPQHAEALWSLTLARLEDALATADSAGERSAAFEEALRGLANVRALDPGFENGWTLAATVEAARGDCKAALAIRDEWHSLPSRIQRRFPVPAGNGAGLSASIGRRRLISPRRAELQPEGALAMCTQEKN